MARKRLGDSESLLETLTGKKEKAVRRPKPASRELKKESDVRATFVMNKNTLDDIKALAWYNRMTLKDFLNMALQDFIQSSKDLGKARGLFGKK